MCRHFQTARMIIPSNTNPGMMPAVNVWETGAPVGALNRIAALEGGISDSISAADAARTTTNGVGYPSWII